MVGGVTQVVIGFFFQAAFRGHINFAADDRFQSVFDRPVIEIHRPEQVAMVGHGNGGHVELCRPLEQGLVPQRRVEEAVKSV